VIQHSSRKMCVHYELDWGPNGTIGSSLRKERARFKGSLIVNIHQRLRGDGSRCGRLLARIRAGESP